MEHGVEEDFLGGRLVQGRPIVFRAAVHGEGGDHFDDEAGGELGIGGRAKGAGCHAAVQVAGQEGKDARPVAAKPEPGQARPIGGGAFEELECEPVAGGFAEEFADDRLQFRARIGGGASAGGGGQCGQAEPGSERFLDEGEEGGFTGATQREREGLSGVIRIHGAAQDEFEQGLLAFHVEVQSAGGDAHGGGDGGHLGLAVALFEEDGGGGLDEGGEAVGVARSGHK